jgi:hypothetical protein
MLSRDDQIKIKTWITIAFMANADGPLYIDHAQKSHVFNKKSNDDFNFLYQWNKKACVAPIIKFILIFPLPTTFCVELSPINIFTSDGFLKLIILIHFMIKVHGGIGIRIPCSILNINKVVITKAPLW